MNRAIKLTTDGTDVACLKITGDPRNNEPAHVRILFPFGHVEVTRATDGPGADYWVHVYVNTSKSGHHVPEDEDPGCPPRPARKKRWGLGSG
jgi:hypothetical protein